MNSYIRREYLRLRKLGWRASDSIRAARVWDAWTDAENDGLVRLDVEQDDPEVALDGDFDDATRAKLIERINRDGATCIMGSYRSPDGEWIQCDNVGGFIGDDWRDSGYDTDVMRSTLDAMREAWDEHHQAEAEALARRATYAGAP